jgi:hypothetical protein
MNDLRNPRRLLDLLSELTADADEAEERGNEREAERLRKRRDEIEARSEEPR